MSLSYVEDFLLESLFLLMVVITVCSANNLKSYLILSGINILFYPADSVNLSSSRSHFTEDSQ